MNSRRKPRAMQNAPARTILITLRIRFLFEILPRNMPIPIRIIKAKTVPI
jgi:hypothetical protein